MFLVVVVILVGFLWLVYFLMPASSVLPILSYQKISVSERDRLTVSTHQFNEQLALIERLGYTPISFSDLKAFISGALPLPDKKVLLTFDGSDESVYHLAYPLLEKYQFKATIFVPSSPIATLIARAEGNKRIVDHETSRSMSSELIEVGLLSHRNYPLSSAA